MNYKNLYFDDPQLDIADVLTSVGVTVKIGTSIIAWAHDVSDFGAQPEGLDCTPLSSKVHLEKSGVIEQEQWTVDYYFNEDDYNAIEALKGGTTSSNLEVAMNDGSKFTNKGTVSANYVSGFGVNGMVDAHAVVNLSGEWTFVPAG